MANEDMGHPEKGRRNEGGRKSGGKVMGNQLLEGRWGGEEGIRCQSRGNRGKL